MIGPLVGHEFGGNEDIVDINFKGANSGENNLLSCILIHKQILFLHYLLVLYEFVRHRVLYYHCVIDEFLNLALYYLIHQVR